MAAAPGAVLSTRAAVELISSTLEVNANVADTQNQYDISALHGLPSMIGFINVIHFK